MIIMVITEVFPPKHGGSGRWFWELYRRLPPNTVRFVTHDWPGAKIFDTTHEMVIDRIPLHFSHWGVLKWSGFIEYIRATRHLRRLIRRYRPDVLHCGKCLPEGFLAWGQRQFGGPPYWCYTHGEELMFARDSRELRWITQRVLEGAEHIIANCNTTANILYRDWQIKKNRLSVFYPGVDATKFTPASHNATIRKRLDWGDRPVILTVGALCARKGQDTMIRALPEIRKAIPEVLYVIAGEGWERSRLENLAKELEVTGAVQFRGPPTDVDLIDCYQQCDFFALPNRQEGNDQEGFGIVLLEAQSCGKPVIAGTSGGTVETMIVPDTGIVIDCTIPDRLAEVTIEWLCNPALREIKGRAARQWILDKFDWTVLIEEARLLFGLNNSSRCVEREVIS